MKIKAAIAREVGKLTIEEIELDPPKAGELLVRMEAAGVCHSDLHNYRGELRSTPPLVLGHEGAGVVEEVGPGVTRFQPGDRIVVNWLPGCDVCPSCLRGEPTFCERLASTTFQDLAVDGTSRLKTLDGIQLKHLLSSATMAEYAVIHQDGAVAIPEGVPFDVAAITGCAVMTGVGAVINTAEVPAGSTTAVIGCGGVGLSIIQGCQLSGCYPIIAVDVMESKLELARRLGATETVNARQVDVVERLRELTDGRGPDYVFDSVGAAQTIPQALKAARLGGTAVVTGMFAAQAEVSIPPRDLVNRGRSLLGCFAGSARPKVDLPKLLKLYQGGRLQLDELISKRYPLEDLPQAFADMEAGKVARGVLVFEH